MAQPRRGITFVEKIEKMLRAVGTALAEANTMPKQSSIQPLVRHTIEYSKKDNQLQVTTANYICE